MSDLISRQDAVDEIQMLMEQSEDDEHDKIWNNAIRGAVNAVKHHTKSAQPEPQWIPCSERLPEDGQEVLVYAVGKADGFIGDNVIALSERFMFRLFPAWNGVGQWKSPWEYFSSNYEITHWMPLPDPPKGEQE